MSTSEHPAGDRADPKPSSSSAARTGTQVVTAARAAPHAGERIVVNMGPQHPSTHGVLRLILEIEGETIVEARCGIGYLHTGIEKNLEFRNWTQGVTFVTRMDYLSPLFNETVYCLGVEKLLGVTDDIPERASVIRVMMMELNRISSATWSRWPPAAWSWAPWARCSTGSANASRSCRSSRRSPGCG